MSKYHLENFLEAELQEKGYRLGPRRCIEQIKKEAEVDDVFLGLENLKKTPSMNLFYAIFGTPDQRR
jgi:hypothetical protein